MTMLEAAQKIPKGVNIVIFIWALIGLYFLLRNPKIRKDFYFWLFTAVIGFMVAWRIVIRILTSRYAAGLIVPFAVLAAVFLVNSAKRRHFIVRLGFYVLIAVTGFIVLKMNVDSTTRNSYSDMIAEVFEGLGSSRPEDYTFVVEHDDYSRMLFQTHLGDNVGRLKEENVRDYVLGYRRIYPDTILNAPSKTVTDEISRLDNMRLLASLIERKTSKKIKKQLIYAMSGRDECVPVSKDRIVPCPENNLLENGGMELPDSPEESSEKFRTYLGPDFSPDSGGPAARTPRGAYFTFVPADETDAAVAPETIAALPPATVSPPVFDLRDDPAVDGNRSVWIRTSNGTASMLFEKCFGPGGQYEYSMLVQGEKGTEVRVFYEACGADGGREPRTVATLTLPDRRLFQVTTHFSASDPADADGFRVGISVRHGGAHFDNFSLTQVSSAPGPD